MNRDVDRPIWKGQRPWFEIWFAVVLDAHRRRALWIRESLFVPRTGEPRATVWAAWFDADASPVRRAAKRFIPLASPVSVDSETALVEIDGARLGRGGATGQVSGLAWDATWSGGRQLAPEVPSWLPATTHTRPIVHDAEATALVTLDGAAPIAITGRAIAMHLWGKKRVPTLHWIWSPWTGDGSLEVSAVSLQNHFSMGLASLRLDGPAPFAGRPGTAAHPHGLITATVAGPRRLVHARAWAEPQAMVGYAYRDTDDRDLMIAQSDVGSAHYEAFARTAPGVMWKPIEERRAEGGVAVEIHQRTPLPGVAYLPWDGTTLPAPEKVADPPRTDELEWPPVSAIVALGLTYADHVRETGQKIDASTPIMTFTKHLRSLVRGEVGTPVPTTAALRATIDELDPGLGTHLAERLAYFPAIMDYEGELALIALGPIDAERLAAGEPQPFGMAACNDLTSRFVQVLGEDTERQLDYWAAAKSFKRFLPAASRVWAPDGGIAQIPELEIEVKVNGELRQRASTKLLIYKLPAIVRAAAAELGRPLMRGDVIITGTPAGVGLRLNKIKRKVAGLVKDRVRKAELLVSTYAGSAALLRPGDVIEVDAGRAGRVRSRLVI
ncbi:MAG: fumarylacetoacetate hydrolase family protein [Proteobacteria bacterium]|nr:fumarylacetoacetate hydrolase family protein [Pseudomonadota bacterium]